ncbi:MAG: aminomethyl-transferring glycine dehydrogenase [Chromatiales bacterium]|nr:aminomethyl-transferring glycine dehydrogenase [Chromatiales bacterium]
MSETTYSIDSLEDSGAFIRRHIGPDAGDQARMLELLGIASLEELAERVVPPAIYDRIPLDLAESVGEAGALAKLRRIASSNKVMRSLIGMGYYNTHTPGVILRNVLENPGWYTAYTPYQPEISQGRLEALINFQTMVADLTGMDLANASLLDEATAAAEAMALCQRMSKSKSVRFFVAADCHPQTIEVVQTRAEPIGVEVVVGNPFTDLDADDVFGVLLQYPSTDGSILDYRELVEKVHAGKALVAVATDLLALTLLAPPGAWGADMALGSSQRFGVPLGYGGPHAAFLATRDAYKRSLPGRIVGASVDSQGAAAYRLALQTREQHIRREKATSNICTAQVLLAVMASLYAVYHGPQGLERIARRVHRYTAMLAKGLGSLGYGMQTQAFFDTLVVETGAKTAELHQKARAAGFNLREIATDRIGISLDETVTREELGTLIGLFGGSPEALDTQADDVIPAGLARSGEFLTHPVFHRYHSETEMLRYLRLLSDKDIALDRAMIPLGSCTMKLNATSEMIPVTWPEFASLHPFAPQDQAQGYQQMIQDLERMLCACTGYAAVSLQPNAGSQGEYAGLLAIRAYHKSRGEGHRKVCLIPSSAHGTNPASAQMAGMQVVVVRCDDHGNVDVDDLRAKAGKHKDELAALMVTYPSTHGVFEEAIREICAIVHDNGGQVYMDGANLNALVGLASPGRFGSDVSHLNLHKTFCIPHGGGGPGVGPIGVGEHLAPYLPGLPVFDGERSGDRVGPVSAAPWGSAAILPISWMYISMMGREGMRKATLSAILNANYIARRLRDHFPVLYTGPNDLVAHECIIDLRPLKDTTGVTVEDVAKRLIDYGFHAPTMSFPVAGTLMIEPTESESKHELDRFCDAMIRIRAEIDQVGRGEWPAEDNPLHNAPHTAQVVCADEWNHPYSRSTAAYPLASLRKNKYWTPVGRVDNVFGDRNLACSCLPMEAYE